MTNWRKYILAVAAVATAAGFGYIKSSHKNIPSDLRDAVADKGFDTSIPSFEKGAGNIPEPKAEAVKGINKGYVNVNAPSAGAPAQNRAVYCHTSLYREKGKCHIPFSYYAEAPGLPGPG